MCIINAKAINNTPACDPNFVTLFGDSHFADHTNAYSMKTALKSLYALGVVY